MKKFSLFIAALALVFVTSQCRKEDKPLQNGEKQHIVLTANNGNDGSKVAGQFVTDELDLKWETEDVINVTGGASGTLSLLEGAGTKSATFVGDIEKGTGETLQFTVGTQPAYLNQTGADSFITDNICLVGFSGYHEDGNYTVDMKLPYAVLKLDLSYFGSDAKAGVDVEIKVQDEPIAKVTGVTSASTEMFVAIPADNTEKTYVFNDDVEKTWTLAPNVFYTKKGSETGEAIAIEPAPAPTAVFSVSTDKTVTFAPGNLFWDGSAFKFEANQWTYQTSWDPTHVGQFWWSTDAAKACAKDFDGSSCGEVDQTAYLFTEQEGFSVNGETGWHALTSVEWNYLIAPSQAKSGSRENATNLRKRIEVEGKTGLVILPDGADYETAFGTGADAITTFAKLADYGAVFIPEASYRYGDYFDDGYYFMMGDAWQNGIGAGTDRVTSILTYVEGLGIMTMGIPVNTEGASYTGAFPLRLAKYNN